MMQRAEGVLEHLDRPVASADRDASLADIDRLNTWFGGYALTLGAIQRVASGVPAWRRLVVVDVGGGRGDFARWLIRHAGRLERRIHIVVVDRDPDFLAAATRRPHPDVSLVRADATALPFRQDGADVITMSLTLHHLEPDAAVTSLGEMRRAARLDVIVNDLLRTRLSLLLVWVATRLVGRHPFSRHDGPLSVRRAYSPEELRTLAEKAGIHAVRVERYPWLGRLLAVIAP
ncbi:MAG TPA: methyltransferase domain-containing protein [Methylomirabilota bacterium]|jgi:ubiquinone/menaquinone biosynthesis C-methylase UbiE|nr:methyltransferase domain-containing protein [Methylomirabilota bacterium]